MSVNDAAVTAAIESFRSASLGPTAGGSWVEALENLATATNSQVGQLIGLGDHAAIPFNWMTGLPAEAGAEFLMAGGGDSRINSRVRIGARAPELTVLDDTDFTTAEDCRRTPAFGDWIRTYGLEITCLSPLLRLDDMMVGMAVGRRDAQGSYSAEEKQAYAAIAPHARDAVRTQLAIENQSLGLVTSLLDALSTAAFVCDGAGAIRAMSPRGEDLLADGRWLKVARGRLTSRHDGDSRRFDLGLAKVASGVAETMVMRDEDSGDYLHLEFSALPGEHRRFGLSALVVARTMRQETRRTAELARQLFRLTPAEAMVAAQLAAGRGPQSIADETGKSIGTIRTQIRSIFDKAGVQSQLELVAALSLD
ncbi:helix-turn-helix transcriptional regulator [Asticcacaulis biprosthecium]|uniref:helix-turn-helix transcriptional regulator n=1 Tax=Asticcacaulis biprosthecium TaxID=76891 RepID=UPI0012F488BB|nr:helix-turn-helix transcriptional regulator [Asticcacaulis biprosthecium]